MQITPMMAATTMRWVSLNLLTILLYLIITIIISKVISNGLTRVDRQNTIKTINLWTPWVAVDWGKKISWICQLLVIPLHNKIMQVVFTITIITLKVIAVIYPRISQLMMSMTNSKVSDRSLRRLDRLRNRWRNLSVLIWMSRISC